MSASDRHPTPVPRLPTADSRLPKFWEVWGEAEARYNVVRLYAVSVTALAGLLFVGLIYLAARPRPVLVVPGASEGGVFRPGEVPTEYIEDTAKSFILSFANWNYSTADKAFAAVRAMMDKVVLAEFDVRVSDRLEDIRRNQISEVFHVGEGRIVSQKGDRYLVRLEGLREMYVGTKPVWTGPYFYEVELRRRAPTPAAPRAVAVVKVNQGAIQTGGQVETSAGPP
ncbi:MAG: hypothetical protein HYY13_13615 [Nitrospirae bacterium]|nr:hypothetical protein [Nitrospirota bacterium]